MNTAFDAALNSKRMPHLDHHALDCVGVLALGELLIANVKHNNNANRYHEPFHQTLLARSCRAAGYGRGGSECRDDAGILVGTSVRVGSGSRPDLTFCSNVPSRPQDRLSRAAASA
ncbi:MULTISPECIES: hypothetical protein [Bradyrhizobium]|uniref:hypothetical protein n=1 Tax=Bradyrhizobium TaxID=374 RepID=UPI0012EBFCD5|nr:MULTISPECIES: hypothetical protein [unclassified Bradyrhizobium]QIG98194.1 hypothetical protein G6P99_42375 [Bradyrhizobium sp. 6(2017)]